MSNNKLKQFKQDATSVSLEASQKQTSREEIVQFMKQHPIDSATGTSLWQTLFAPKRLGLVAALTLLVIVSTGGITYAAEHTLPGDVLYPVKLHVNEEVKAMVSLTPEARASWETRRTERRLEEAATLASTGKLTTTTQATIAKLVTRHATRVRNAAATLANKGDITAAAELNSHLETILTVHETVLEHMTEESPERSQNKDTLLSQIHIETNKSADIDMRLDAKIETNTIDIQQVSARQRIDTASETIEEVQTYLAEKKAQLGADATVLAEAQLAEARDILAEAELTFDEKAYADAFKLAGHAKDIAEESKLLVKTRTDLNINIDLEPILKKPTLKIPLETKIQLPSSATQQLPQETDVPTTIKIPTPSEIQIKTNIDSDTSIKSKF